MMVDVQAIVPWLALAAAVGSLFYTMKRDRSQAMDQKMASLTTFVDTRASKEHVSSVAEKLDKLEDRTTRIESEMKHLPDNGTVNRLEQRIAEMSTQVGVLAARIEPVSRVADRLQEKLLESVGS